MIVVDASMVVLAVLPVSAQPSALERFGSWHHAGERVLAPSLWLGEAVSVIRKHAHAGALTTAEARGAVEDLFALGIESVPMDLTLCEGALRWAEQLRQARAYDGFYAALAERHGAALWTADERLAGGLQLLGGLSVHVVEAV